MLRRASLLQYLYEQSKNKKRVAFVRRYIPTAGVGAELGVHKGFFTRVLLEIARPEKLYIVDPWYLLGGAWSWSGGNPSTARALSNIVRRFTNELVSGQLVLRIESDLDFLSRLSPASLDWAYIDSSHEYGHTAAELELLATRVKPGGTIAGDDWQWNPGHRHYGVARAVTEFVERTGLAFDYQGDSDGQWAFRLGSAHPSVPPSP